MLTFLRKIRKSLIESSPAVASAKEGGSARKPAYAPSLKLWSKRPAGRYILYAIGEIALVVIGILIALQINNWNERRINNIQEDLYIKGIERDLKEQIDHIETQIAWELEMARIAKDVLIKFESASEFYIDSVFVVGLGSLTLRKTFTMRDATFEDLISSGNINIIRNPTFRDYLIKYYEKLERVVVIIHKNNSFFIDQEFVPNVVKIIPIMRTESINQTVGLSDLQAFPDEQYIPIINEKLMHLAQIRANNSDNITSLYSSISLRYDFSMIALGFMMDLKSSTQELLEQITQ